MSDRKRNPPYTSEHLVLRCMDCPEGFNANVSPSSPYRCRKPEGAEHRIMDKATGKQLAAQ